MNRDKLLLIVGAVALIGILAAAAFFLGGREQPEETPEPAPMVTIDPGTPPGAAEPEHETAPEAEEEGPGHDDHDHGPGGHDHDPGPGPACVDSPEGCDALGVVVSDPVDEAAASALRPRIAEFVGTWVNLNAGESDADRTTRLAAAGAGEKVATQVTALARKNTAQTGLTPQTKLSTLTRTLFTGREDGLLVFQVAVEVDATYLQADNTGSKRIVGGIIHVHTKDDGTVQKVVESFPTLENAR